MPDSLVLAFLDSLSVERSLSGNTVASYKRDLAGFAKWSQKPITLSDRNDIRTFLRAVMAAGVSPTSAARKLSCLRTFYAWLVDEGAMQSDPTRGIPLPKTWKVMPKSLTTEEIDKVVASCGDTPLDIRDKALLLVAFGSGLRVSELVHLALTDVDLKRGLLWVRRGKGQKDRMTPVSPPAVAAIADYLEHSRPLLLRDTQSLFLFVGRCSERQLTRQGVFARIRERVAGVLGKNVSPHWFRHSAATELLKGGADLRDIQAILGHASIDTTAIYLDTDINQLRAAYYAAHPRGRMSHEKQH